MEIPRALTVVRGLDPWIVIPVVLLFATSIMVLFSIDHATGSGDRATKQLLFAALGLVVYFALSAVRSQTLEAFGPWVYVAGVVMLLAVLFFGRTINGTTGWFVVAGFSFQPVELVKICFIWGMCWYISRLGGQSYSWKTLLLCFALLGGLVGLVLLQPDFGSAMMLVAIFLGIIFVVHRVRWHLVLLAAAFLVSVVVAWFFLNTIQQNRILSFIHPELDPLNSGYNVQQSIIATGSGQWFGRGLGLGTQSQLHFLPEQSTDFIFSVIAEELGFLGAAGLLGLYVVLIWRLQSMSRTAPSSFGSMLAHGLLVYFLTQLFINVGMNMGVVPVTGLPLPLVSAGGSSILASCIGLGIVQASSKNQHSSST